MKAKVLKIVKKCYLYSGLEEGLQKYIGKIGDVIYQTISNKKNIQLKFDDGIKIFFRKKDVEIIED